MSGHAMLSPSSANRWIHCPPSAKINAEAADQVTVYTREGTLAHAVAEFKARKYFLTGIGPKKFKAGMDRFRAEELWQDEMDGHTDAYLDALKDIAATFDAPPHVALEVRVDFSEYVPEGFGTADCLMIGGETLHIVDFKYGRGLEVSAENNPQMMLYALGAVLDYMAVYDIFTVRMTIVQPRIKREPDTWELPARELLRWAEDVVKPAAKLAAAGEGEFSEGAWCRFCAIRASCRARAEAQLALARMEFRRPPELSDAEVSEALTEGQRLETWLTELKKYALGACLDGREIPGYKAVAGSGKRVWTDAEAALAAARAAGVPEDKLYDSKPASPAELEKVMGRKSFAEALGDYVAMPPGKPALVTADDKREAVTNKPDPEDDFGEELPF